MNYCHFVALISEKLPQKVLYLLYMLRADGEEWTVPKLQSLLGKHITVLEMAGSESCFIQASLRPSNKQSHREANPYHPRPTAGGLLAGTSKGTATLRQQPQLNCVYCSEPDLSDKCTKYTTLQSRRDKLKGSSFKCLQRGHVAKSSRRDRPCVHCNKPSHHGSLCPKLFNPQPNAPPLPESQNVSNEVDANVMMLTSSNQVQMQTATSMVKKLIR